MHCVAEETPINHVLLRGRRIEQTALVTTANGAALPNTFCMICMMRWGVFE
jgi:hypothetical protein